MLGLAEDSVAVLSHSCKRKAGDIIQVATKGYFRHTSFAQKIADGFALRVAHFEGDQAAGI